MTQTTKGTRFVKPAKCECELLDQPFCACETFPNGFPGTMRINETVYAVHVLSSLPPAPAEPIIDGFRLTKDNGESHDICLVAGRMECTCGDYEFRRAALQNPDICDCKHILACKRLLYYQPRDQYEPAVRTGEYAVEFDDP